MESNQKFKLLGFTRHGTLAANVMVLATGKTITMGLNELADSDISEDLSRHELQALYRKIYGNNQQQTAYELSDRHERSWYAYLIITVALSVIYIFSTLCGVKPIQIPALNLITPPAIFIYPLTFILVDILNEFYGLRLARRTIIISFMANLVFVLGVWATTLVPSIPQWEFSKTYDGIVHSIMAVLVASSAAYLISENVNSYLLCKIKELTNSRYLFVRVITSTVVASAIDSVVFCTLAFYNVLSWDIIKTMILSQFLIKVVYALVGVGPIYAARSLFNRYINTDLARSNKYAYQETR
ncbi:queuosine precursor transporter [Serratia plymuthica]|uniref:queuosine precursor transporter n=1 Tax=Serratia plymuthica TaxID=82996 RepID=UPI0004562F02|nr:queuosine precursor transporter [Serratia plymuthica]AHY09242.1 membrane protein [Serratia plymuthica]MBL3522613.1 queuosine precursor transporter [Serratia plymuthica]MEB6540848.1 queuosine precursor transporter [Serratia plymuthica]